MGFVRPGHLQGLSSTGTLLTHVTPAQEHVITGEEVAEHIEMGGRAAREKLAMKLPKFGQPQTVRPARRTDSLLNEVVSILMLILLTWLQSFSSLYLSQALVFRPTARSPEAHHMSLMAVRRKVSRTTASI